MVWPWGQQGALSWERPPTYDNHCVRHESFQWVERVCKAVESFVTSLNCSSFLIAGTERRKQFGGNLRITDVTLCQNVRMFIPFMTWLWHFIMSVNSDSYINLLFFFFTIWMYPPKSDLKAPSLHAVRSACPHKKKQLITTRIYVSLLGGDFCWL